MGLWVAETAIVFDYLRSVFRDHKAEIEAAFEGSSFFVHGFDRWKEDLFHALFGDFFGVIRVWGDCAHAAGIETFVVIEGAFVVHAGNHWLKGLAIGEGKDGNLWSF